MSVVAALAVVGSAVTAGAKEPGAECRPLLRAATRMETAIALGSKMFNAGNHVACAKLYRETAEGILRELVDGCASPIAVLLKDGLGRAEASSHAGTAAWEMRYAFEAVRILIAEGRLVNPPAAPQLEAPGAPYYGEQCPNVLAVARQAELALASAPEARVEKARALVASLRERKQCERAAREIAEALAAVADRPKKRGRRAPAEGLAGLDAALVRITWGEPPEGVYAGRPEIAQACDRLPEVIDRVGDAIRTGTPIYNQGSHALARNTYQRTAESILGELAGPGQCPRVRDRLQRGLREMAEARTPAHAAWALRRAFDTLLAEVFPAKKGEGDDAAQPKAAAPASGS